jgi:hypothetical protein
MINFDINEFILHLLYSIFNQIILVCLTSIKNINSTSQVFTTKVRKNIILSLCKLLNMNIGSS